MENFGLLISRAPVLALALGLSAVGCGASGEGQDGEESIGVTSEAIGFQSHDYLFFQTAKNRADAEAACEAVDTLNRYRLAVPDNEEEQAFLTQEENSHGGGRWWIGVNDINTEGVFTTGYQGAFVAPAPHDIAYSHWHTGEPNNNGNEDCVMDNYYSEGSGSLTDRTWNDSNCGNTANFVCERGSTDNDSDRWYGADNTNSAQTRTVGYPFRVNAGQAVTVGTCGLPDADDFGTDTYLRVYNPVGQQVGFNDDACGGRGSNFSFVAATTGTFTVKSGCYQNTTCSGKVVISVQ